MAEFDHDARRLNWDGCPNARDLGGFPAAEGKWTRRGAIVRSDSPHRLSDVGQQSLVDHGVRTIVDLRLPEEVSANSYPFAEPGAHGITYRNVSFIDPAAPGPTGPQSLADDYVDMLDRYRSRVVDAMRAIALAPPGGVLIHCAAGKDRTGLISALLLDLVGVPRRLIAEDYALSSHYLRAQTDEWIAREPEKRAEREADVARWWTRPEVMLDVLDRLDRRHRGTAEYLRAAGLSEGDVAAIRERLAGF
jgi:protein-tyrosine phosphatase